MSKEIQKYLTKIDELEQKIMALELSESITIEKLKTRNLHLSNISTLNAKIQNLENGLPANGYGDILKPISQNDIGV